MSVNDQCFADSGKANLCMSRLSRVQSGVGNKEEKPEDLVSPFPSATFDRFNHGGDHYPGGVDRHDQSQRLRALAALLWALRLSHQNISYLLTALGPTIAKMTSWRDIQEARVVLQQGRGRTGVVEVIGADETVVKVKGQQMVVGLVVDPATGELLGLEFRGEQDTPAFMTGCGLMWNGM